MHEVEGRNRAVDLGHFEGDGACLQIRALRLVEADALELGHEPEGKVSRVDVLIDLSRVLFHDGTSGLSLPLLLRAQIAIEAHAGPHIVSWLSFLRRLGRLELVAQNR